jgi:hypothetical protein
MQKRVVQLSSTEHADTETGEVFPSILVQVRRKEPGAFAEFVQVGQGGMRRISKLGLTGEQHDVLWAILGRVGFENVVIVNQAEIARDLGIRAPQVSRSIRRLVESRLLTPGPKVGANQSYSINPTFFWRGQGRKHQQAAREYEKRRIDAMVQPTTEQPISTVPQFFQAFVEEQDGGIVLPFPRGTRKRQAHRAEADTPPPEYIELLARWPNRLHEWERILEEHPDARGDVDLDSPRPARRKASR